MPLGAALYTRFRAYAEILITGIAIPAERACRTELVEPEQRGLDFKCDRSQDSIHGARQRRRRCPGTHRILRAKTMLQDPE